MTKTDHTECSRLATADERGLDSNFVVLRLRAAETHERAAEFHKQAADYFERCAAFDHAHGWADSASRLERHADRRREAAALEQDRADRIRDALARRDRSPHDG